MSNITELEIRHNRQLADNAAECTVLLKTNGKFPLKKPCKIALYGNGARNTIKGGTGSGGVNSRFYITAEQGLENAGFTVTTKNWLDAYDTERKSRHSEFLDGIKKKAEKDGVSLFVAGFGAIEPEYEYDLPLDGEGEACIYVLARVSGEGNDRKTVKGDICLTNTEINDILYLADKYDKFMLVLNVGGVVDISPVISVPNILLLSQLGVVTGDILADIVLGKANPSGKLTTTWAGHEDYCKLGTFGGLDDARYNEGVYVGYRYFDTAGIKPLFPFGYGLSYTDFSIRFNSVHNDNEVITVKAAVKNVGKFAGKEVVQLYVACPIGNIDKPENCLAAFVKTKLLKPGESEQVLLQFKMSDIASFDTVNSRFILEAGTYILKLGNSSRDTVTCAAVDIACEIVTEEVRAFKFKADFEDKKFFCKTEKADDVPKIRLDRKDFVTKKANYDLVEDTHPLTEKLTDEQLCYLCIGAYLNNNTGGVIGGSSFHVAGAAGETTNRLPEYLGNKFVVMADGPAGLRITREYVKGENGTVIPLIRELPDGLGEILDPSVTAYLKHVYENTPKETVNEQYTTAIPIGTAIAQSWNIEFARICGNIVGEEMQRFGVHIWLAPALNIQRDIRCGRNFEYYSEDPLISGKIAAAIVNGVQNNNNCGVTIKHFAVNNQETNRYNNNSILSERALREIYLKGFKICIEESRPEALMTSYNLVNGVHTSENRQLITDILRCEMGFKGVVMTDWITTGVVYNKKSKHPAAYASNIVKAGNDLTMAGAQVDYDDLSAAVKAGKVTREELVQCASRVLYLIDKHN